MQQPFWFRLRRVRGYYEFEPVKKTKDDASWVAGAVGKVVKMVYMLLYDLPDGFEYRVVFMQRELSETLAWQKKMLERSVIWRRFMRLQSVGG